MNSLSQYLTENVSELVYELKSETYLNAAKKAKKLADPRVTKFLQAYKDSIDKELNSIEIPGDKEKKFLDYYNKDKKSIQKIYSLSNKKEGISLFKSDFGYYIKIQNTYFDGFVYVVPNKDKDRQIFLRQSVIDQEKWNKISKYLDSIGIKITDPDTPFTYIQVFDKSSYFDFFYIINSDKFIPGTLNQKGSQYKDNDCLTKYSDINKNAINDICKAINQSHKSI